MTGIRECNMCMKGLWKQLRVYSIIVLFWYCMRQSTQKNACYYLHDYKSVPRHNVYMYGTAKKKRPCYLVGNLVATNWPIEKALHAIGYNQIPTK